MVDFKEIITTEILADYLTADFGQDLVIWEDNSHATIDSSSVFWHKAKLQTLCRVKCPGINNLDSTMFSEDYAARDINGTYFEIDTGREIGDLASMICWTCHEGDVSAFMEDLIVKCENSFCTEQTYPQQKAMS